MATNKLLRKRITSLIIDFAFCGFIKVLLVHSYLNFIKSGIVKLPFALKKKIVLNLGQLDLPLSVGIIFFYFFCCMFCANGKTLGKKIQGLRTVDNNGNENVSFFQSLVKSCGYLMGYITLGLVFLTNFASKNGRGFADIASSTSTILEGELPKHNEEIADNFFNLLDQEEHTLCPVLNYNLLRAPISRLENSSVDEDDEFNIAA